MQQSSVASVEARYPRFSLHLCQLNLRSLCLPHRSNRWSNLAVCLHHRHHPCPNRVSSERDPSWMEGSLS